MARGLPARPAGRAWASADDLWRRACSGPAGMQGSCGGQGCASGRPGGRCPAPVADGWTGSAWRSVVRGGGWDALLGSL